MSGQPEPRIVRLVTGRRAKAEARASAPFLITPNLVAPDCLTDQEKRAFIGLACGYSSTEIARHYSLSVKTITTYRSRIMEKLGMSSNADIVRLAYAPAMAALSREQAQRSGAGILSPVDQTQFGFGGNCQSACMAMILGMPLSVVPNFHELAGDRDDNYGLRWNTAVDNWLASKGFGRMCVKASDDWRERYRGFIAVAGKSPRGDFDHVCVYRDGVLWHDPHPDRTGLLTETSMEVYYALKGYSASGVGA